MTTLDPLPAFHRSVIRLACSACGAEANASCNCGKPYMPAAARAAEAVKSDPEKSNRAIAAEVGVSEPTVRRARGASSDAPDTVTGRDGKAYPARREPSEPAPPSPAIPKTKVVQEHEANAALALQLIGLGYRALAQKLQADRAAMARLNRVSDEMRKAWDVDWF